MPGYIDQGRDAGFTLATGGGRPKDLERGWYVEPTVFGNVDNSSVFTPDVERARQVAGQLRSGTVGHNAFRTDFGIAFGGFKQPAGYENTAVKGAARAGFPARAVSVGAGGRGADVEDHAVAGAGDAWSAAP